jgi:ATP-dependent Clp protease ATP-binding subunit ClpA
MFERFTKAARSAVIQAQEDARALGHHTILPEHLLLGVLSDEHDRAAAAVRSLGLEREGLMREVRAMGTSDAEALRAIGVDLDAVRRHAEETFGPGALDRPRRRRRGWLRSRLLSEHVPFTDASKAALEQSLREALALRHRYIGSEHLVLGLLAQRHGGVPDLLRRSQVDPDDLRNRILEGFPRAA